MKISTKGRYSLLVMIDLTENQSDDFIPLRDIAKRQDISEKYLESIIKLLVKNKLLVGLRGKGGGYKLTKRPSDITVGEVLRIAEENIMIDEEDTDSMYRTSEYRTIDMWSRLSKMINNFFDSISIADLIVVLPYTFVSGKTFFINILFLCRYLYYLNNHINSLLYGLYTDKFKPAVEVFTACKDIRSRQSHK